MRKTIRAQKKSSIRFSWVTTPSAAKKLARFFVANVHPRYISHGEIQIGRALDEYTWHPDLESIIEREIRRKVAVSFRSGRVAMARDGHEIVGLMIFELFKRSDGHRYAVLEDQLIARDRRGEGVGSRFMRWQEQQLQKIGIHEVFLESGRRNTAAHRFFHRQGFRPVSIVMRKEMAPARRRR